MEGITEPKTEKYIYALLPARDRVMREMERYAAKNHVPIIGPACGRLLYQFARLIQARRVFEMGSAIGYSTLWLARAVGPRGRVFYTDRKSTRLNSSHTVISYAVFCLKKKKTETKQESVHQCT